MAKTPRRKRAARADRMEWRPIDSLRPHPDNTRTHSAEQLSELRHSLRTYNWTRPVMVVDDIKAWPPGTIIVGHGFVEAAKMEGFTEAKVLVCEGWTEAQARGYMIADNALPLLAGWDEEKLREQIRLLNEGGFDMRALGFSKDELDSKLKAFVEGPPKTGVPGSLSAKFGVPPFSVLNAREGWWQDRKAAWIALGIESERGRGDGGVTGGAPEPLARARAGDASPMAKPARTKLVPGGGSPRPLDRKRAAAKASPGRSQMPAADYRKRQRGDGKGRPASGA